MHSMREVPAGDYKTSKVTWLQDGSVRGKVETAIRSALVKAAEMMVLDREQRHPREQDYHCASPQTPELHVHEVGCHWLCRRSTEVPSAHAEPGRLFVKLRMCGSKQSKEQFSGKGVWK